MLRSARKMPLVAKEDIKVWKVFCSDKGDWGNELFTPMIGTIIPPLPYDMTAKRLPGSKPSKITTDKTGHYYIGEGYIHAYVIKKRARSAAEKWYDKFSCEHKHANPYDYRAYVVEGYIPKGTRYHIEDAETPTHICAKLISLKRITNEIYNDGEDYRFNFRYNNWEQRYWW